MADYDQEFDGARLKAGFRSSILDDKPATEMVPPPCGTGWYQVDWRGAGDNDVVMYFDFAGLRQVVERILESVRVQVATMTGDELWKLRKVNDRLPFFYVQQS